ASLRGLREREIGHCRELVGILAVDAFLPWIDLCVLLRVDEAVVVVATLLYILDDCCLDRGRADAPGPVVDAFEITALLAVELDESSDDFERFILALGVAKHFGALDIHAGSSGEVELIA